MASVRRLAAHYAYTPEGLLRDIVVTVDDRGVILGLEFCPQPDKVHGVEFYSGILVPGFVNCHCHLELSHMRGEIPEGCGFAEFGKGMAASRNRYGIESQQQAASFHDARMWAEGISAVGDISNSSNTLSVKSSSRILYNTFVEVYGLGLSSTQRFEELLRLMREQGQLAGLTPHSMYSLNEGLLTQTVEADEGTLSIHFMESRQERELFSGKGEMKEWFAESGFTEDFTALYGSPAERVVKNIPPERKISLVHNTFVTEEDIDLINGHFGPNVTWVVCPRSNGYITGSLPPWEMLIRKGCRIAVGTDSLASNTSLSILEELMAIGADLGRMLGWVTLNGAVALGLQETHGSLQPGKKPGVAVIERLDMAKIRLTSQSVARRLV